MTEKSEILAQQVKSAGVKVGSGPTIELVTPKAGRDMEASGIICPPNCLPNCPPSCLPSFPGPCAPDYRLPIPKPPGPPN